MKFDTHIEQFIELRIEGKSFDDIAKELKTSKSTLLDWNKQFKVRETITEQKALKINALFKQFELDRESKLRANLELIQKLYNELSSRDLTQVPTLKLMDMLIVQESRIKDLIGESVSFGGKDSAIPLKEWSNGFFNMSLDD